MWNDTITIYHKTGERQYSRTVLTGCEWQGETKIAPSERGIVINNLVNLYIRGGIGTLPELCTGDMIVKGECNLTITGAADLRRAGSPMMTAQAVISYYPESVKVEKWRS